MTVCVVCSLLKAIRHAVARHVFVESPTSSSDDSDHESQFCFTCAPVIYIILVTGIYFHQENLIDFLWNRLVSGHVVERNFLMFTMFIKMSLVDLFFSGQNTCKQQDFVSSIQCLRPNNVCTWKCCSLVLLSMLMCVGCVIGVMYCRQYSSTSCQVSSRHRNNHK